MKKLLTIITLLLLATLSFGQAYPFDMVAHDGGTGKETTYDVCVDASGNKYITGKHNAEINFGSGVVIAKPVDNYDVFVAKYDKDNNIQWAKSFGGKSIDEGRAIAVDNNGNVIVAASFFKNVVLGTDTLSTFGTLDIAIVKFDASGNYLWMKHAHTANQDKPADLQIDSHGNYVLLGYYGDDAVDTLKYEGLEIISHGEREVFVIKMEPDGNPIWGVTGGGAQNDYAGGLVIDKNDNIYFNGHYYKAEATFGSTTLPFVDGYEVFTAKLNSAGTYQWAVAATGTKNEKAYGIDYIDKGDSSPGSVIITGYFEDSLFAGTNSEARFKSAGDDDLFVLAYSSDGVYEGGLRFGGEEDEQGRTIKSIVGNGGGYFVGGTIESNIDLPNIKLTNSGKRDMLVMRLNKKDIVWAKNYGGSDNDYISSGAIDATGMVYFSGYFKSSVGEFAPFSLTGKGDYDLWLGQMKEQATIPPKLFINEFLASNDSNYYDTRTKDYPDWIEVYNASEKAVDIGGMYITDDLTELNMWQIPTTAPDTTTIPAGGFLLLLADKKPDAGVLHVKLKLSGKGEQIGLTLSDGTTVVDSLTYGEQTTDTSMGRISDGSLTWDFFSIASPGVSNSKGTVVGIKTDDGFIVTKYNLEQNYPNPFNPSTVINFSIPESGLVTLKVFNVLGQEVAELVNNIKSAGSYEVSFDASNLTTGMYIYRIQSNNFTSTRKMMLVK